MKKLLLLTLLAACACHRQPQQIIDSINYLEDKETFLESRIRGLRMLESELSTKVDSLKLDHKLLTAIKDGKTINYILKIKGQQSRFSLSISDHIKDSANSFEFEIPVSKEFYDEQEIGENILKSFRGGSFVLNGSVGSMNLTVVDKRVVVND